MKGYCHYFVEGADEKRLLDTLKTDMRLILPGKVEKFNVVQDKLTKNRLMALKYPTTVIMVFDIDAGNVDILMENIKFLKRQKSQIKDIICITQVMNLEEELVRSCRIKNILELTKSRSQKDYKHDLIHIKNLASRLKECQFDFSKFWIMQPENQYKDIKNEADKVKLF